MGQLIPKQFGRQYNPTAWGGIEQPTTGFGGGTLGFGNGSLVNVPTALTKPQKQLFYNPKMGTPSLFPELNAEPGANGQPIETPEGIQDDPTTQGSLYSFINQIREDDLGLLADQEKLIKDKTLMDMIGSGYSLYENLTANLPDPITPMRVTATENRLPINAIKEIGNEQQGNLISTGRAMARTSGQQGIYSGLSGNIVDQNNAFNENFSTGMTDFYNQQQQIDNTVNATNAQSRALANEANRKQTQEDNLRRSEIASGMISQMGNTMTQGRAGLINLRGQRTQNDVMYEYGKQLVDAGEYEKLMQLLGGFMDVNVSDTPMDDVSEAAKY